MAMALRLLLLASVGSLVVAALDVKSVDEVPSRRLQQGLSLPERFIQRYTISQDQILALSPQCVSYLQCIMQVPVSLVLLGMAPSGPARTGQDPLSWLCNEGQSFLGMRPDIAQSCAVVIPATTTTLTTTTTTSEKLTTTTNRTIPTTTTSVAITNDTEATGASDVTRRRLQQLPMLPQWFVESYNIGQDRLLALPPQCVSNLQCNLQTTLSVALLGWASAWPGASQDPLDWLCNEAESFLRRYTAIAQACPTWTTTTTTVYVPPTSPPAAMPYYPYPWYAPYGVPGPAPVYVPYAAPARMPYYPWYMPGARAATNPAVISDPTIVMDPTVVISPGGPGGPGSILSPGTPGAPGGWGSGGSFGRPWTPTGSPGRFGRPWTPTGSPRTPVSSGGFGRPSSPWTRPSGTAPWTRPSGTGSYGGWSQGRSSGGRFR